MSRVRLDPGSVETRVLLAWVGKQIEADAGALEARGVAHDESNFLRGRIAARRSIQRLADDREVKIDGKTV